MRYRHYKGGIYELVCEARLEAGHIPVIVYRGEDGAVWVRPRDVFFETVTLGGVRQPRFAPLGEVRDATGDAQPCAMPAVSGN